VTEPTSDGGRQTALQVFVAFLRLGLTTFGGPIAHLGYFRDDFVVRRRWLDEATYADLVALCRFLPGPASSQVGIGIGLAKAGLPGALAVWVGFTLPSAVALTLLGYGVVAFGDAFLRAGSLVFGGGHVVLPLLQAEVVPPGWVSNEALCLVAIFVPSFLLVIGVLPFWSHLREAAALRRALVGVNAAVAWAMAEVLAS
jgi:chromate transporter